MGRKRRPFRELEADIDDLSHDGRGVARIDGKVWFIDGALPGERVRFLEQKGRRKTGAGKTLEVLSASPDRVEPRCEHFGVCGGCATQHLAHASQLKDKHAQLMMSFEKLAGGLMPQVIFEPLTAPEPWRYRRRARLGARYVPKKGGVLVGFRERGSSYITQIDACHVLRPEVAAAIPKMPELIGALSCATKIPQIEVAVGDKATTFVFRHLEPLGDTDQMTLATWGSENNIQIYLQPGGLDTVHPIWPANPQTLTYRMDAFDIEIAFEPMDFVQVNGDMNAVLVERAIELLEPGADDTVLDMFCGIGNFTLPLARRSSRVLGIEGDESLVERARANAQRNGLNNVTFETSNLYDESFSMAALPGPFERVLIDPPRSGALEVVTQLNDPYIQRVVYVSCNPATLARDAQIMVEKNGFVLNAAGIVDMFPHTAHVESIAVFDRATH